jgi:hypothetical protein
MTSIHYGTLVEDKKDCVGLWELWGLKDTVWQKHPMVLK